MQTTCPGCRRPLRMKEELAGTLVRCPACSLEFVANAGAEPETGIRPGEAPSGPAAANEHVRETEPPAPPSRPPRYDDDDDFDEPRRRHRGPDMARARDRVNGPAIALLVVGILCILGAFARAGLNAVGAAGGGNQVAAINAGVGLVGSVLPIATSILIIIGANKMRNLDNIGLAKAAAILAMIPCTSGLACIVGLPFGIWAMTALSDSNVIDAFAMKRRRYPGDDHDRERERDRD
jgi:hypothetical protein